jgi:hypothetical protein
MTDAKTAFALEVKGHSGKWIKSRLGSARGPQITFADEQVGKDYIRHQLGNCQAFRLVKTEG